MHTISKNHTLYRIMFFHEFWYILTDIQKQIRTHRLFFQLIYFIFLQIYIQIRLGRGPHQEHLRSWNHEHHRQSWRHPLESPRSWKCPWFAASWRELQQHQSCPMKNILILNAAILFYYHFYKQAKNFHGNFYSSKLLHRGSFYAISLFLCVLCAFFAILPWDF